MSRKVEILLGFLCLIAVLIIWSSAVADTQKSKTANSKIRVGVFDSRAVACAHFHRFIEEDGLEKLYRAHDKAKKKGDTERAEELAEKGVALQKQIHMRVFGTADIDDIIEEIEKDIAAIAEAENVDVVVNKWDIVYQKPYVRFVDVTGRLVDLFEPDEETREKIKAIMDTPPLPLEQLEKMDHSKH